MRTIKIILGILLLSVLVQAQAVVPSTFFGFNQNNSVPSAWPTASFGLQRYWDANNLAWPSINTSNGVFVYGTLDAELAKAFTQGTKVSFFTMSRTPQWASSQPADTTCNYQGGTGGGHGECFPPSDLASDGSGTNAIWKAWVTSIATHVNDPTYLLTHSYIKYWELVNEPDSPLFWSGSIAQLARMVEDANCIITGRGVIHQSGNGTATPCTATPIDPNAQIVMPSFHSKGVALTYGKNELYCNQSPSGLQLPCPNPLTAIAAAVDIINPHQKPLNESGNNCPAPTPCTIESALIWYTNSIHGILQSAELAKPIWNGEAALSSLGFTGAYADGDMAASAMPRFYLMSWSLGYSSISWGTWENINTQPKAVVAHQQSYNWMVGSQMTTPCASVGSVFTCGITKGGARYQIMWDNSQSCASGSCTMATQTVGSDWTYQQDMTTASTPSLIGASHSISLGIKPIVLSTHFTLVNINSQTQRPLPQNRVGAGTEPNLNSTCAGTQNWDTALSSFASATLTTTGTCTLTVSGLALNGNYTLTVKQGGSGTLSLGTGCSWKVSGGGNGIVSQSSATNAQDILSFVYDGTNCVATYAKNFN